MFTTNIDSKIEISYSSTEQISPETRSPGISDRSRVSITLTPRGDSLQNTQRVTTYYTPYGASASETELPDHMAQSATPKTPLGTPVFWESGANPPSEWSTWFGTLEMAIMVRDNLVVDKLLRLKPARSELFYPTLPTYEDPFEGETEDEELQREQRNEKRKVDWENECKQIEYKGPMIDRTPWDEADLKVKSLIYLSFDTEGCRTYHQRNPHTRIERCTTNELVHELSLTFTRPRNLTFDRFQFFRALQQSNESLETFYSRLRELGSHAKLEHLEEDLVKDLFISNMQSTNIQMQLLSEVRTAQQILNFAVNRERGLANQQEIQKARSNWNTVSYVRQNKQRNNIYVQNQNVQNQKITPCRKCGNPFSMAHLQICPAKNTQCNICKKVGHFASRCTVKMPERRTPRKPQLTTPGQYATPQTRRVRHVKNENNQGDSTEESVDAEAALYIKKLHEDWANINLIRPTEFNPQKNDQINKNTNGEFWVKTTTKAEKIQWLADTGSPRSLINTQKAFEMSNKIDNAVIHPYNEETKYRCFNNNDIAIKGVLHMELKSGSWNDKNRKILVVDNKTNNIMGRDVLAKLGITLKAEKPHGKQVHTILNIQTEKNIIKWIFQKYPHLCTRLGRSKNHIAKSLLRQNYTPSQHKGRRVPLHLLDKVELELKKLVDDEQIMKLKKCPDDLFISPVVITVKKDKSFKIALDSKKLNDAIHKNKYQIQSIDHLIDSVAVSISERRNLPGKYFFPKIDLKYAYSQIPLDENIQKHCNFNILGGRATGTYRFINGFYGLTDMQATFQKTIDKTLQKVTTKFAFLDDILVVTKGNLQEHENELDKILKKLNDENLASDKFTKMQIRERRHSMARV